MKAKRCDTELLQKKILLSNAQVLKTQLFENPCSVGHRSKMAHHQVRSNYRIFNPLMGSITSRLRTFQGWPITKHQKPEDLAKCGFYYLGDGDKVVCFHCGVGLKDWLVADNVWLEHALNSSTCPYLLLNKKKAQVGEQEDYRFRKLMVNAQFQIICLLKAIHKCLNGTLLAFRTSFCNLMKLQILNSKHH
jgi:hypothetical protein